MYVVVILPPLSHTHMHDSCTDRAPVVGVGGGQVVGATLEAGPGSASKMRVALWYRTNFSSAKPSVIVALILLQFLDNCFN